MKITKDNYENFLIDRIEGALSPSDEAELDAFLEKEPALKEELSLLEMTRLVPDLDVVFEGKESLKKNEGRVIPLMAMSRWLAVAAAVTVVFIGVRFLGTNNENGKSYRTADREFNLPVRQTEKEEEEMLPETEYANTQAPVYFANEEQSTEPKSAAPAQRESNFMLAGLEVKPTRTLESVPVKGRLKSAGFEEAYAYTNRYNYENMMKDVYEDENDVETIVDRWNDAVATVKDMTSVLGLGKEGKEKTQESEVKTTSIKILGFEYYNRKHINN